MKKVKILFGQLTIITAALLLLSSCAVIDNITSLIGLDTYDYMGENVTGSIEAGSEEWCAIEEMLPMLTLDSVELPEFNGADEAQKLYCDSLLNFMLDKSYSMYAGNPALLDKVQKAYPEYELISAIPKEDFESMMYRFFGGSSKITHKSTVLFNYLDRAEVYIPVSSPIGSSTEIKLNSVLVTKHSYRISFTVSAGDATQEYFALIIKRDDGTLFFRNLMHKT